MSYRVTSTYRCYNKGFTLLELIVVIGIVGIVSALAMPDMSLRSKKKFNNSYNETLQQLSIARNIAISRGTTTRIEITNIDDKYTITSFASDVPTTLCSDVGTWEEVAKKTFSILGNYTVEAEDIICYYRDGSSSGGEINIEPIADSPGTNYGKASIEAIAATGYSDITITVP